MLLLDPVAGVSVGLAGGRLVDDVEPGTGVAPPFLVVDEELFPPRRAAAVVAGPLPAALLVQAGQDLAGLDRVDQGEAAAVDDRSGEGAALRVDRDLVGPRGQPVAEAAADDALRRGQHRHRLAPSPHVVQLVPHHRAEDPLAPVRR